MAEAGATLLENKAQITAELPYLRSDLQKLHVEFTARILGEEVLDRRPTEIRNGRLGDLSLDREGLMITRWPVEVVEQRLDDLMGDKTLLQAPQALRDYWDQTIPLIRQLSGARDVLPVHASTIRKSTRNNPDKKMTPAGWVHLDYDPDEAKVQLEETFELNHFEPRPFSRYVLYQGWRVLSDPPQDFPLAICDGRTTDPEDIIPIDYHMKTEEREVTYRSRGSRHNPRHRWWYFPEMTRDEMIVFTGFDSALGDGFKTLHVAFEDPTVTDPIPRASIETRYFALFE